MNQYISIELTFPFHVIQDKNILCMKSMDTGNKLFMDDATYSNHYYLIENLFKQILSIRQDSNLQYLLFYATQDKNILAKLLSCWKINTISIYSNFNLPKRNEVSPHIREPEFWMNFAIRTGQ